MNNFTFHCKQEVYSKAKVTPACSPALTPKICTVVSVVSLQNPATCVFVNFFPAEFFKNLFCYIFSPLFSILISTPSVVSGENGWEMKIGSRIK